MQNFTYAGRVYLNPTRPREMYINIGWNTRGGQRYAQYHPGFGISEAQYNGLINEAKCLFVNGPRISVCGGFCSMILCVATSGICFCPFLYIKSTVDSFNKQANLSITNAGEQLNLQARLAMIQVAGAHGGNWVDSSGNPLLISGKSGSFPGGPPMGYNIIVTLPSQLQWPPTSMPAMAVGQTTIMSAGMPLALGVPVSPERGGAPVGQAIVCPAGNDPKAAGKILQLKQLLDAGAISEAEFESKKMELLAAI